MRTIITDLNNPADQATYSNDLSLTENLVSHILLAQKRAGHLLDSAARKLIKEDYTIKEGISSFSGRAFAYCESLGLHARVDTDTKQFRSTGKHYRK